MDAVDHGILKLLRTDARMPFTEVGKVLGISDATVHHRVKRMVNGGIVKRFTIEVDEEAQGNMSCFLRIDVDPGCIEEVIRELMNYGEVEEVFETHGPSDLVARITASNVQAIREVILRVRRLPHIVQTELITILKRWRRD